MRAPQRDVWGSRDSFVRLPPPPAAHALSPFSAALPKCSSSLQMEEVTDTASFQPSCDDGACGRGWPLWGIYYALWWCVTEVRSEDSGYGWKSAELTKLLPDIPFSTSSHCRFAEVTQSSRDQWVPLDRHAESHKHNRQTQRGTEKEGDGVSFKVCVCVCAYMRMFMCVCTYMHMFMYVCACLPANVHVWAFIDYNGVSVQQNIWNERFSPNDFSIYFL